MGEDEFWLVSPSENLIRIEVVDNELRKEELQALVQQDGSDDLVELFKQVSLEPGKDDEVKWRGGSYYQGEHKTAKLQPGPYYLPHSAAMQHELYGMMPYYQPPMMSYAPPTGMALPQGSMMYPTAPSHPLSLAPPSNGMYPTNHTCPSTTNNMCPSTNSTHPTMVLKAIPMAMEHPIMPSPPAPKGAAGTAESMGSQQPGMPLPEQTADRK